jgi:hypothetical protein
MKKILIIGTLAIAAVLVFGAVGVAYAQTATPNQTGSGMQRGGNSGMMGQVGSGLLHDYMLAGFADAFGISVEDLQARLDSGETMHDVALSLDMTQEEFNALWITVRTEAINQALADGVLTQDQADWLLTRIAMRQAGGGTCTGDCSMSGRGGMGGGMGGMGGGRGAGTGTCIQP